MVNPLSALSCIALFALLSTLAPQSAAIPLRSAEAVPDHWAQLLQADRYELVPRPSWTTHASHSDHNANASSVRATLQDHVPSAARTYAKLDLDLDPVSRTKIFKGSGDKSNFECHVHDPPQAIRIQQVISKVITVCEASWTSSEKVLMQLTFADLGAEETLANGGGTFFVKMKDTFETVLPVAAAEAVRGRDLNGNRKGDGRFDVLVTVNINTPWYDGIDGNCPPEQYDLVTVILHEVYHNLLFAGSIMADVDTNQQVDGAVLQTASLYKGYRTRFDSFLMNEGNCAVLSYLTAQELSSQTGLTPNQLFADAVCNDRLYWGYGNQKIAKLHSPRVFRRKSSIYHFDPNSTDTVDSLMFPTVRRGPSGVQHVVSERILLMQAASLDPKIPGANPSCVRLSNPTPAVAIQQGQTNTNIFHGAITPNIVVADEAHCSHRPRWEIPLLAMDRLHQELRQLPRLRSVPSGGRRGRRSRLRKGPRSTPRYRRTPSRRLRTHRRMANKRAHHLASV
ncbi:hypothetical protein FGB62_1g015 [Gracilaria domingensis]|nr:hypothetical protein FGB62_1g015 [Gracilaria domingensis]